MYSSGPPTGLSRLHIPVAFCSFGDLRKFVSWHAVSAGFDAQQAFLIQVTAIEVLSNVIRHTQGLPPLATMAVSSKLDATGLALRFDYGGHAFTPVAACRCLADTDSAPFDPHMPSTRGFGLAIIHRTADAVRYTHQDGVNRVHLHFQR